jgi:GDP-L-fucose synthase
VGVYPDMEVFKEDQVWGRPPHPSDWYGAWSKRFGELQCEAYLEQYKYKTCIVRPATIYGPYDNFDPQTAMVVPALIQRVAGGEDPLVVWGDGSAKRDFIYSEDCARGMMRVMEHYYECDPINLGSGVGVSIQEVVDIICRHAPKAPKVVWDASKPTGNKIRLMDMSKAQARAGFRAQISLEEGIRRTMEWHLKNMDYQSKRFKVFSA